jgi:hypothetical protein
MDATVTAALISALAALFAAVMSAFTARLRLTTGASCEADDQESADPEQDTRLNEARHYLQRQEAMARWNCRAAASLTFSQYIVGGILATSFVQEALSREVVGFLGLLVLIASLIHHRYRPDIYASCARERAVQLRALIRKAEDALYAIRSGRSDAPSLLKIRKMVSQELAEIEARELRDMETDREEGAAN